MEDPLANGSRAIYARLGTIPEYKSSSGVFEDASIADDSIWSGLFTRPAILALKDEDSGGFPKRAVSRACRMLLEEKTTDENLLDRVAEACGFSGAEELSRYFYDGTGWNPLDWLNRFGNV